ncbi:hypothetical protein [Microcoleus sp. LEGE 07076]|nr:hypothetical protein [Microcoleus sp. LEGE 07076]
MGSDPGASKFYYQVRSHRCGVSRQPEKYNLDALGVTPNHQY